MLGSSTGIFGKMAPIAVKEVVVFSSEDPRFPAQNILTGQKWLTDSKDTSGKAMIEFQLDRASQIHYIDIGHYNVASLEIAVGRSSWPSSRSYVILLPTVMLQTPLEARSGRNKTGCKMYKYPENFSSDVVKEKWDRIRVSLNQPFVRNKQLGLEFIRFASPRNTTTASNKPEITQASLASSLTAPWKNSSIGKLADSLNKKREETNDLEDKLLRISSTTEDGSGEKYTLSRTAKMVLSSRSGVRTPQSLRKHPSTPTSNRKGTLCGLTDTTPPLNRSPFQLKTGPTTKPSGSGHSGKIFPTSDDNRTQKFSDARRNGAMDSSFVPQVMKTKSEKNINTSYKFKGTNSLNVDSSINRGSSEQSYTSDLASSSSGTKQRTSDYTPQDSDAGGDVRQSPGTQRVQAMSRSPALSGAKTDGTRGELSKDEVKIIKKLVQRFFNTLDMEELDPHNVTLKELRMSFEAINDVKLDKDGREYFKSITASYLELAMTCRQHKGKGGEKHVQQPESLLHSNGTPTRKRKSSESIASTSSAPRALKVHSSPAKMRRTSRQDSMDHDCEIISVDNTSAMVQCPLCMEMFPQDIVSEHAAVCGEDDVIETTGNTESSSRDVQITSVFSPQRRHIQTFPRETVLDMSDNMRLTEEEKKYWMNFTKQPKPFHPRMDSDLYRGSKLVKCPTCGQFYKSEEIQEHSDDCAEKVNSGCERRGLYYVKKKSGNVVKNV